MNGALWIMLTGFVCIFILGYYSERKFWTAIGGGCLGAVLGGVAALILLAFADVSPEKVVEKVWRTEYIYSLKDAGVDYSGDFVLGTGSISSTWYYAAFVNTDDGYHKETFDQKMTYIKEIAYGKPKVEKYLAVEHRNWLMTWLTGNKIDNACCYHKYILHVPKGTIIKEFRLE